MKKLMLVAVSALLLGACASSGSREGMVYRDGSWYAPAEDGRERRLEGDLVLRGGPVAGIDGAARDAVGHVGRREHEHLAQDVHRALRENPGQAGTV